MSSSRRSNRTLNRQLVIRITLIVTAAAVAVAALSTLMVTGILVGNLDQQLKHAIHVGDTRPQAPGRDAPDDGPSGGARVGGLPTGSIAVVQTSGGGLESTIVYDTGLLRADEEEIAALLALEADGRLRTVRLAGLGNYRTIAVADGDTLYAVAAPMAITEAIVTRMLMIDLALIVLAAAAAAGISTIVVRDSLRPLNRLAETATRVASLPLESGEVDLAVRVPESEADGRSEVGQVGAAFNSMLDHVEDSLRTRQESETRVRQFVADASHELRNPLASIRGYAELTKRSGEPLPPDTVFALGRIESESQRMSRLVEQMLLLARLDAGPDAATTVIDLSETVLDCVSDARAAGPDHEWQVSLPDAPVHVLADQHQLVQVMTNLLGNARKHTPPGTVVSTAVTVSPGWAQVEVSDNGPGIEPELLGHVFERFSKADQSRAHDGEGSTGLGLAIVAAVTKAAGGRVEVASRRASEREPGCTTFTVRLPLARGGPPRPPVTGPPSNRC